MKFYYSPNSCALAVHIALEEAGAEYEAQKVNFDHQEQRSAAYLAINPLGRVPVLHTEAGVLTEAPAILGFIAARFPGAQLAPPDLYNLAKMNAFNAFISSTVHVGYAHSTRPYRWSDDETSFAGMRKKAAESFAEHFQMIESAKLAGPWVMGEQFTVADPYLYAMTRWLNRLKIDVNAYPKVAQHLRRMNERAAVQRVLALHP
jgi:glutathione S-transferase